MLKIIITGSSSFLGRNLLKFSPSGRKIFAFYRHNKPVGYGQDIKYVQLDLLSPNWDSLEKIHVDVIIHAAAMASLDECETQPEIAHRINYESTNRLVKYADKIGARFIFISTDVVFDGNKGNYVEDDIPKPLNVYAQTKVKAENFILSQHKNAVIVRPSIFYGRALNGRPSFTEIMMKNLYAGKQVFLFTDQIRTPLYVKDLASAIWELIDHNHCGALHIGGPQQLSRWQIGQILCRVFNFDENLLIPVKSEEVNLVALRPLDCSLNTNLASSILKTTFVDCSVGLNLAFR